MSAIGGILGFCTTQESPTSLVFIHDINYQVLGKVHLRNLLWPFPFFFMKECSFCEDPRFARTGVCISCDAGMCRAYFHVTCAQKEGLLSEAAAEEVGMERIE